MSKRPRQKKAPPPSTFKCAACQGVFEKGWSDEEAEQELGEKFPGITTDECDQICDDCFKKYGLDKI